MMNDLISRQAAIDALWNALYAYEDKTEKQFQESDELDVGDWTVHRIFVQNMSDIDRQTILALPSAQPEQKRGKWVDGWSSGFDGMRHWFRECSVCGYGRDDDNPENDTNFCPDCGADMRGEGHE